MVDAGAEALVLSEDNADLEFLPAHEKARVLLEYAESKVVGDVVDEYGPVQRLLGGFFMESG